MLGSLRRSDRRATFQLTCVGFVSSPWALPARLGAHWCGQGSAVLATWLRGLWLPEVLVLVAWSGDSVLGGVKDTKKPGLQKEAWNWEGKAGWEPGGAQWEG